MFWSSAQGGAAMAERVKKAVEELQATGKTMAGSPGDRA
jgi:hypothetical protein